MELEISKIEITPAKGKHGLIAYVSCVVNEQFFIGNISIHSTFVKENFILNYPYQSTGKNKIFTCVHPINKETKCAMSKAISIEFKKIFPGYDDTGNPLEFK